MGFTTGLLQPLDGAGSIFEGCAYSYVTLQLTEVHKRIRPRIFNLGALLLLVWTAASPAHAKTDSRMDGTVFKVCEHHICSFRWPLIFMLRAYIGTNIALFDNLSAGSAHTRART